MERQIIFGIEGWRGILNIEMNENTVIRIAHSFLEYLQKHYQKAENASVAVGYDGRKLSEKFAYTIARVLAAKKIDVHLSDQIIPTPVLTYYIKAKELDAGIMITASNKSPAYSGVKLRGPGGGSFIKEEQLIIEPTIAVKDTSQSSDYRKVNMLRPYYEHIHSFINFDAIKAKNLHLCIDSMNGAGKMIIEQILKEKDIQATTHFGEIEPDFRGRSPIPEAQNLTHLSKLMSSSNKFAFGVATDGDGDRVGIILEDGSFLHYQLLSLMITDYYLNKRNVDGNIVKTSAITDKLSLLLKPDSTISDVRIGFKHIVSEMMKNDVAIGIEEGGGFGYKDNIPGRDGLFTSFLMLEMLATSDFGNLTELKNHYIEKFGDIHYKYSNLIYTPQKRNEILPVMFKIAPHHVSKFKVNDLREFYSTDGTIRGLKFYLSGQSRWLLLRCSQFEPVLRVYSEGETEDEAEAINTFGRELLQAYF